MMAQLTTTQAVRYPVVRCTSRRRAPMRVVAGTQQHETDAFGASRRSIGALLGAALIAVSANPLPAHAAFGDPAKVFGAKPTNATGFVPYEGGGFSLLLPSRWVPSAERDARDVKLRMEDTYPANNLLVMAKKTDKKSISDFGPPEAFLKEMAFLFGDNTWQGQTRSEGGFGPNKVSAASILDAGQVTGKDGKPHYNAHVLIRSADGNEGGRHHIISAAVSNGQLYILKAQIGDKRWNKGGARDSQVLQQSFFIA